jgi:hypothetical protein
MTENSLENLLRGGKSDPRPVDPPPGFAQRAFARYQSQRRREKIVSGTALLSLVTACCILGSIVQLNYEHLTAGSAEEFDPVMEMADSVWDSAGN